MKNKALLWCLLCCLFLTGCQPNRSPNAINVQVQRIVSGHTIEVFDPTRQPRGSDRVRLIGIEAPDLKQHPWGAAAKARLEQILSEKTDQQLVLAPAILEPDIKPEQDSSGRWPAYVWRNDVLVNEQLVKEGYVLAAPRAPNNKYDYRLARAQEYARIMGYGIWNPAQPMRLTPAEFRRLPNNTNP